MPKTTVVEPPKMPREELRELIELGYASKSRTVREAAGVIDTWAHKVTFYHDYLRMVLGLPDYVA
jgi:hypothetical protein